MNLSGSANNCLIETVHVSKKLKKNKRGKLEDFRRLTYAPVHTLYHIQAAQVLQDLRLYVLFMLKPRHARYRTFRTEEQQQLHTHSSLFHNWRFITGGSQQGLHHRGFTTRASPQWAPPQGFTTGAFTTGGSPQGVQHKFLPWGEGGLFLLVWVKFHLKPTS